ncbi:sigma-54 interaction domain-containing protein [Megasphaera vaginalis (ex Bordigoni et al. 2020)]|uniref:sigma-54 interaction domain-containing protein n=1 Tax=Megasphaera vaginalis (ex Bordigoni et al. 2020) TaxID=2045301 RepID=UPI000C7C0174|nr:sigma 54-interacting transcriptional regulator [Megasphaera vaginalis (ex Bordigoni et al. 2020)]
MEKISFLLADEILKKEVEQILWIYRSEQEKIDIRTEIGIIDLEHIEKQAQDMIAGGAQVIITNSGSHSILSRTITEVPILCLYSSTSDTLYTLHQVASYNTIHLLLNKNFIFNAELCSDDIKKKLKIHSSYSVDTTYHELRTIVNRIPVTSDAVLVGCTLLPQIANTPLPIMPIRPSESAILSVYQYACELISFKRQGQNWGAMISAVLENFNDGIIICDAAGKIYHINKMAKRFLKTAGNPGYLRDVLPGILEEGAGPQQLKEKIVTLAPYTLVITTSTFRVDRDQHYALNIRDVTELQHLEKHIRYKLSKTGLQAQHHFSDIKTINDGMKNIIHTAATMATYDAPVLIQGESGTGKELFAQSIHNHSPRRNGPFVVVNCAALPSDLLESELFGYVGGAFTGARKEGKAGLFELAHNGTIFLDEINSMSPNIQSKLLRVLETKEVMRIGSDYIIPLDIRVISASNADIMQAVLSGAFRRDLFFRLNTLTLNLPSLNERKEDIVYLFAFFMEKISGKKGRGKAVPPQLQNALERHRWWGNIRELHSVAMRYHIFSDSCSDDYGELFDDVKQPASVTGTLRHDEMVPDLDMKKLQASFQQLVIQDLLDQGYTKVQVAKILHLSRQTLFNRLKQ